MKKPRILPQGGGYETKDTAEGGEGGVMKPRILNLSNMRQVFSLYHYTGPNASLNARLNC